MIYFQKQVDEIIRAKDSQVAELRDRVKYLEAQLVIERQRAEVAINGALSQVSAAPLPLTQAPKEPLSPEKKAEQEKVKKNMEKFLSVGLMPDLEEAI